MSRSKVSDARSGERGIALISTLALVVVVSLLIVAFVTMMRLDRSATASYSQSLKAEQLGLGGLHLIVGQLQNEMAKDAPPDLTYPANLLYTNVGSANIQPQGVGTNSAMPTLVKISTNAPFYSGTQAAGALTASGISSTTPSQNGRWVSTTIWNQAYLGTFPNNASAPYWVVMTRGGATNGASLPFGPTTANSLNNPASGNNNYVVGRIAYAVYDEGGLLDVTVAGYPTSGSTAALSASQLQSIKGTLAGADVSTLGIDPNALTVWRNQTSAANASSYTNYVSSFLSTNGGRAVYPGDTTFLSRQDLIQAAKNGTAGLSTSALTNLTTFTRERNAPGWSPRQDASAMGGSNGTGSIYAYKSNALSSSLTATNVCIPFIRYPAAKTVTAYRTDGTSYSYSVTPGDPLVYRRFPLDRLNWIGNNGPNAAAFNGSLTAAQQATAIQACFGLKWVKSTDTGASTDTYGTTISLWQYVGPTGSTEQSSIETLAQVLAETTAREPNFFELLQAGILSGSLAMDGGGASTNPFTTYHQQKSAFQLFRIGASIISQYESKCYPVVIEYNESGAPWQACGIQNLPYLNYLTYNYGYNSTPTASQANLQQYLMVSLWNPHQGVNAAALSSRPNVRLRMRGALGVSNNYYNGSDSFMSGSPPSSTVGVHGTMTGSAAVQLSQTAGAGVNGFADAAVPAPSDLSASPGAGTTSGLTWSLMPALSTTDLTQYLGFRLPDFPISMSTAATATATPPSLAVQALRWSSLRIALGIDANDLVNAWLEYQVPDNTWVPYQYAIGINDPATGLNTSSSAVPVGIYSGSLGAGTAGVKASPPKYDLSNLTAAKQTSYGYGPLLALCDPRSSRFNFTEVQGITRPYWKQGAWSSNTIPAQQANGEVGVPFIPTNFSQSNPYYPLWFCRNNAVSASQTYGYTDPDGVLRIADSGLYTTPPNGAGTSPTVGNPYGLSTDPRGSADRPIILNRPFYSVGELGYVNRDDPWRTLDFFTANSADSGLLDIFTVCDTDQKIVSGRVNLNTQNSAVLQAVLNNTVADIVGVSSISKPQQIAADMVTFTAPGSANGFLIGKDQIASKFVASLTTSDFTATDEQLIKNRREAVTRALADVGQTRTWNLMIDVVAQAGRYPPTATALDQFVVEGERRYWLHVAIDRLTGQVIDQQLEPYAP